MIARSIPVVSDTDFRRLADERPQLLHQSPWIVEGYTSRWKTYAEWQDLDRLRARFGHLQAFAKAPNFITNRRSTLVSVETDFARYIDYVRAPDRIEELYRGRWLEGDHERYVAQGLPLYCGTLRIVHSPDDPVLSELDPLVPPPLRPWNHALPYYYSLFNHFWLLVSRPGALTPLHTDNNGTIALIAQLKGCKRAILYSPDDHHHVCNPGVGYLDPLQPDERDFPTWRQAVKWTADLHPGQVLFVGTGWAHHVQTLETSISVSFDFVDQTNLHAYAESSGWSTMLGDRIKRNPSLASARMGAAFPRPRIDGQPAPQLGRAVMAHVLESALANGVHTEVDRIRQRFLHALQPHLVDFDGAAVAESRPPIDVRFRKPLSEFVNPAGTPPGSRERDDGTGGVDSHRASGTTFASSQS